MNITDAELKALLNRGGIGETLYEGEIGEMNMTTWRNLAEVFFDYYDMKHYNDRDNNGQYSEHA